MGYEEVLLREWVCCYPFHILAGGLDMMVGAQVAIMDFELETYKLNKGMAKSGDHELWTAYLQRQFETNLIISDMYAYFCIRNI